MTRVPFRPIAGFLVAVAGLLLFVTGAEAGISSIAAHGDSFSATERIPVFVDSSVKNSIMVKGQYMDLCTGVESNDQSFSVQIGRRIGGSNSAVEILVGAGSAPDADGATITIKFVSGQETFKVKAFKTAISGYNINGTHASASCKVGENVVLKVHGAVANLGIGAAGAMLDVADSRYALLSGRLSTSTDNTAKFNLKCTAQGQFTVQRTWFTDTRVGSSVAGQAMVRGSATITVTVNPVPVPKKVPK